MSSYDDELLATFLRNEPGIKRYLAKVTGSEHDADDLAQEAWIKLARNGAAALAAPLPYLVRIARTLALDHHKVRNRRLTTGDVDALMDIPSDYPDSAKQAEDRDQVRWLSRIIDELPDRRRKILIAARLNERRHSEIAAEFGISVRSVELEVRKALDYCAERLHQINQD